MLSQTDKAMLYALEKGYDLVDGKICYKGNHADIIRLHNEGNTYQKIMDITGISSKGTVSFIIKKSMEAEKMR